VGGSTGPGPACVPLKTGYDGDDRPFFIYRERLELVMTGGNRRQQVSRSAGIAGQRLDIGKGIRLAREGRVLPALLGAFVPAFACVACVDELECGSS
jgi:hypothetical protein